MCSTHDLLLCVVVLSLQWRHNARDGVLNHQPHHCLLSRLFVRRSKKTSKLCVTGLCAGNSPGTGEFPAQMASNAENVSIWWRHHVPIYLAHANWMIVLALLQWHDRPSVSEANTTVNEYHETMGAPLLTCFNFNPRMIVNHMHGKVYDEITYPFSNFNDYTVEVWEWIDSCITHIIMDIIAYPCFGLRLNHVSKGGISCPF